MWILFLCLGAGALIAYLVIKSGAVRPSTSKNYPPAPQLAERTCPFCGRTNSIYYTPGKDSYPVLFHCNDCMRYFGDVSRMSPSEKQKYQASEASCKQALELQQLNNLINTVVHFFKNYRHGGTDMPLVGIKNGRIEVWQYDGRPRRVLATYPSVGEIGDQQIVILCYSRLKSEMPHVPFHFGNWFVSIDTSKK